MKRVPKDVQQTLRQFGQQHLVAFWDDLTDVERAEFVDELRQIDFSLINRLYKQANEQNAEVERLLRQCQPPEVIRLGHGTAEWTPQQAKTAGWAALRTGRVGVVLVAGGKGTRLGFPYPKGVFPIGPVSGISLFQLHVEKILALARAAEASIPLVVMTSPATDCQTRAFFEAHEYFGLRKEQIFFLSQGTMPVVDGQTGRLLLARKGRLAQNPDGHGGLLAALARTALLETLHHRGIRHLFYFQVDNPLVDVASPELIGYHVLAKADLTTKVIQKKTPTDRLGNVVQVGDRVHVIEYSDLPEQWANWRYEDGSLVLRYGSIAVHVFEVDFLRQVVLRNDLLPFHVARKKVPFLDKNGNLVEPSGPNAIQFERFIFDVLPHARRPLLVEVLAEEHFAPLKNASGDPAGDTPESVRASLINLWRRWLIKAGMGAAEEVPVEISPLFAWGPEKLREKLAPGTFFSQTTYLR